MFPGNAATRWRSPGGDRVRQVILSPSQNLHDLGGRPRIPSWRSHECPAGPRLRACRRASYIDLYADGDSWTTDPVAGAELVGEGWLLPGLVDAHTHPGAEDPGTPFDEQLLRADLRDHAAAGVTLIRSPGLAGQPPDWFGAEPDLPRAVHAGPWFAQEGQFFDGWGRRPSHAELPGLAAEQARRTGWAKLIGDWRADDEPIPADVLAAVVAAVHDAGGRVAVHANLRADLQVGGRGRRRLHRARHASRAGPAAADGRGRHRADADVVGDRGRAS